MKRLATIPYIGNTPSRGIKIDWKLVRKEYKKLKIPDCYYDPSQSPLESCKYFMVFSMRSVGKTTEVILLGMILWRLYGIKVQYIRQFESMIMPKTTRDLFSVIGDAQYGYIEKITDGEYNGVCYKSRRWFLCNYDEDGNVINICPEHFMFMASVDRADTYKSGYSAPEGDLIIYDECISRVYPPETDFCVFADLVKTIIRDRESPIIFLLANTIDKEAPLYHELEIYEIVRDMLPGDNVTKTTELGTNIYIEYVSPDIKKRGVLQRVNQLFFGFKNKRLGSITGADWAIKPKPHIPKSLDGEVLHFVIQNLYIMYHGRYVKLDIVQHPRLGTCCYVHWATKVYDDSIILTVEDITDERYYYGLGPRKLRILLARLIEANKFYYASNDLASFVATYINSIPDVV